MIASMDSSHPMSRFGCGKIHTGFLGFLVSVFRESENSAGRSNFVCVL